MQDGKDIASSHTVGPLLPPQGTMFGQRLFSLIAPFVGLIVVVIIFQIIAPDKPINGKALKIIFTHSVITGICAMGMTLIIISGGIDLSVGSAIALTSIATALALRAGWSVPLSILVGVASGGVCGLYNGALITGLRLPPFIATLGTMGFFRGLSKWLASNTAVRPGDSGEMATWVQPFQANGLFAPAVWVMLGLAVVMMIVLRYSLMGRYAYAIGSNESTARLCGIRINRQKLYFYAVAGLLTGLAGVFQFCRLTEGDPTIAVGLELDVIAAVVIGGGSLAGGQGSILGTLVGAFMIMYLRNRCVTLEWPNYVEEIIIGHIIIIAVAVDQFRMRRASRR